MRRGARPGGPVVWHLPHGAGNPRNSEGAFVTLADGRLMFAWTQFYGKSWHDHARARIVARISPDGGQSWPGPERVLVDGEGLWNVMSVSFARLSDGRLALFYVRKNGLLDCRLWMRVSEDEGQHFGPATACIHAPGYFVVNNARVLRTRAGRLIVPAAYHRVRAADDDQHALDLRGIALFYYSDDDGESWHESADWLALPVRDGAGLQEPGVVELSDGRLLGWARTGTGRQWVMRSRDGGERWTRPRRGPFHSPCSPLSMLRLSDAGADSGPHPGALLAVWNDARHLWDEAARTRLLAARESTWLRTPLVWALSTDEGRSFGPPQVIDADPERGYGYAALHEIDGHLLVAACCGRAPAIMLQDLCIWRIALEVR